VREVASHGLGALARDTDTGLLRNVVVIPANTALPATRRSVFATIEESQTRIDVEVTQGDDTNPAAVRRLGRQTVTLPAHPAGAPIEIVYAYTADQVPHLEVNDLTTGQPLGRFAVRNLAAMSDAEVAESVGRIGALALD
jgi:molecular chaperone DnaK